MRTSRVRAYANLDIGAAPGLVRAARIADLLPLLGEVLAQGKIGVGHLQAVAAGAGRVPIEVLAAAQTTLRDLAPHARPGELRRVAGRVQACYDQDAQRRALLLRDGGCVFPGCAAPPAHCQAHHLVYWSHEGKTDLDNLALVCWFHHHLIHKGGWRLERVPARPGEPHRDSDLNRTGQSPGWLATSPDGRQLGRFRQQVA